MTHKTLNIIKLYKITAYNAHVKTGKENYEKYLCPNFLNCFFNVFAYLLNIYRKLQNIPKYKIADKKIKLQRL